MKEDKNKLALYNKGQIALLFIAKILWKAKKLYISTYGIAAKIDIIVAFSIPKTYKAAVLLVDLRKQKK